MTNPTSGRDQILSILESNIESLNERIQHANGDLDLDEERIQLERQRTLAQLASQYRLLARDLDLDEMDSELELLQRAQNLRGEIDD